VVGSSREHQLGQLGEAEGVDLELIASIVDRYVLDRAIEPESGVVDHDVDAAFAGDELLDDALGVFVVDDVHLDGDDPVGGQRS
jgi:hypothetical protein